MPTQKIWGEDAIGDPNQEFIAVPGSTVGGTTTYSTNPIVLQNSAYAIGSTACATGGILKKLPIQETQNTPLFLTTSNIAEIQQYGILPWVNTTTYNQNALVIQPGTTFVYKSLLASNLNQPLTNTTYWVNCGDIATLINKANINSPTFTGTPKAPTPSAGDASTNIATTAFVTNSFTGSKAVFYADSTLSTDQNIDVFTWLASENVTKVRMTHIRIDTTSGFSLTNSSYTVSIAGIYSFNINGSVRASGVTFGTENQVHVGFGVNSANSFAALNSIRIGGTNPENNGVHTPISASYMVRLNVGDIMYPLVFRSATSPSAVSYLSFYRNFSGSLISL